METTDTAAKEFLHAQSERLSKRTFGKYDGVMEMFLVYLNGYGHLYLDVEEDERLEESLNTNPEAVFSSVFGVDKLSESGYSEFFEYFLVRKVIASDSFTRDAVTVIKKWTKWLYESGRIQKSPQDDLLEYFKDGKSKAISNAMKVSNLLYTHAGNNPSETSGEIKEGYFTIVDIAEGKLWLDDIDTVGTVGPVIVPKNITHLCEEGWDLSGVIGQENDKWYVLECWNVYPTG